MTPLIALLLLGATGPDSAVLPPEPVPAPPSFDPRALFLPAEEEEEEARNKWYGAVSLGLNWSSGNTDALSGSASADAAYRREKDRTSFNFLWTYKEDDDVLTDRKSYGALQYDYFLSDKNYALARISAESDLQADLDLRTTIGVGIGRQFADQPVWKFAGELGLAWVDEDYDGTADDEDFPAGRVAYKAAWDPEGAWEFGQTEEFLASLQDSDDLSNRLDTHARLSLTEKLFAQAQWVWSWDNTPADGKDKSDHTVLLSLGWSF